MNVEFVYIILLSINGFMENMESDDVINNDLHNKISINRDVGGTKITYNKIKLAQIEKWDVRTREHSSEPEESIANMLNSSDSFSSPRHADLRPATEPTHSLYIANNNKSVDGVRRNGSVYAALGEGTFKPDETGEADDKAEEIEYDELDIKSEIISHA
jgi:hypothetical protein